MLQVMRPRCRAQYDPEAVTRQVSAGAALAGAPTTAAAPSGEQRVGDDLLRIQP